MATTASHMTGDISRKTPDLCIVGEEDDENYYGHWISGFGFIGVQFPKRTTRKLTPKEVKKYHGRFMLMDGTLIGAINIAGEIFNKHVVVTKENAGDIYTGNLIAPIKVGSVLCVDLENGQYWHSSMIKKILGTKKCPKIQTRNSVYHIEYK